ncbi:hypothetical protein WICPIJ_001330 [Wickerhamomyces pijperi]|uniref:Uncharacterized protein n=1 Tax=Wickerhamomyces pijperi TaxID=599730 RepID=A0A9P8QB03_WICPI|nr:hypothetical protein WICPIJ_001330 [Wickerhamomyces pijperi]
MKNTSLSSISMRKVLLLTCNLSRIDRLNPMGLKHLEDWTKDSLVLSASSIGSGDFKVKSPSPLSAGFTTFIEQSNFISFRALVSNRL